ncbi:MAG TPA: AAA family ATPase [Anaerolineae bacterium]|nr:AAA family ATPase [Anaerolineae bacterium]
MLEVRLLGQFEVLLNGNPVEIASRPAQSLLAYLILNTGSLHRREKLAGLLWPISSEQSARVNLRQSLWRIRKAIPPEAENEATYLLADNFAIGFNSALPHWVDAFVLDQKQPEDWSSKELIECVRVYQGELLPGFYEDWVVLERERLRAAFENKMHLLMDQLVQERQWRDVLDWGERWIAHGEAPEPAYRALMIAYHQLGDTSKMIASYQRCRDTLQAVLGVEPSTQTEELLAHLKEDQAEIVAIASEILEELKTKPLPLQKPAPKPPAFLEEGAGLGKPERPPFVARAQELLRLEEFLENSLSGKGQVVFVTGNAGSGKTALVMEFAHRSQEKVQDLVISMGLCSSLTGIGDPYLPFREILGLLTGDAEAKWLSGALSTNYALRLWDFMPRAVQSLVNEGPDLVGTFVPGTPLISRVQSRLHEDTAWSSQLNRLVERNAVIQVDHAPQQNDLFEQYTRVLQTVSRHTPLMLIMDDFQWADLGSISLLFHLGRQIADSRILLLCVHRPVEEYSRLDQGRHPLLRTISEFKRIFGDIQIDLSQVDETEGMAFVDAFLNTEPNRFEAHFHQELFRHTGGHPLFTIELLRAMEERGDILRDDEHRWVIGPTLNWNDLPSRVEGVVEERVSRLSEELREVLTVASVEGEKFTAEVAANILKADIREILSSLSRKLDKQHRLVAAMGIRRLESRRISEYRFRHLLFQKHFYNGLDAIERAYLHEHVGAELEKLYGDNASEIAVQLAQHFDTAGVPEKTVMYLHIAAERAKRLSANEEAVAHFKRALELLQSLPPGLERTRQELTLQTALGVVLVATKGYAAQEVEGAFTRAQELCEEVGEDPQLFSVLYGLRAFHLARANCAKAHEISKRLLRMAQISEDLDLLIEAQQAMGTILFYLGEFEESRRHLEECLELYSLDHHRTHALQYGQDPGVTCLSYLALVLWCMGYPDGGLKKNQEAMALAEQAAHPFSMALALNFSAMFYHCYRDFQKGLGCAEQAVGLSGTHNFPFFWAMGRSLQGVLMVELEVEDGLEYLREGLGIWLATGAELGRSQFLTFLGWGLGLSGETEEGLGAIEEARERMNETGDRMMEAELHRLKGEVLKVQGASLEEVKACYDQATEVAQRQGAKLFELRATTDLARLWCEHGREKKALKRLGEIYGGISEGLDTPDLREAGVLLEELNQ